MESKQPSPIDLLVEAHAGLERQGPGCAKETGRALAFLGDLDLIANAADLGCGTGAQTLLLAQHLKGSVVGLDLFPAFVDVLNGQAREQGVAHRVRGVVGSMDDLPFQRESLDLIWSEGAIYNIGFERGLNEWRKYLKTGGYVAVSESSWFTEERPAEIHDFWMSVYAEIDTIPNKVAQIQKAGYILVATFILPEYCWTENYFTPLVKAREIFSRKYAGNKTVEELISFQHHEAELYRKYKEFYGYVFYIAKKMK